MSKSSEIDISEFDWLKLQNEIKSDMDESTKERLIRKIKENPLVPIGCLATTAALTYGLYSFRAGQKRMSQMMMRARIVAQGFTVVALVAGLALSAGQVKK